MLTNHKKEKLINNRIYFTEPASESTKNYLVTFDNYEKLFNGKQIKILTDTNKLIIGKLVISENIETSTINYYVEFSNINNGDFNYVGTFKDITLRPENDLLNNENEYITGLDIIKNRLSAKPNIYFNINESILGTSGTITAFEKNKLIDTKIEYTYPNEQHKYINIGSLSYKNIGFVHINKPDTTFHDKTFSHIFGFTNKNINCEIEITLPIDINFLNNSDGNNFIINILKFSTSVEYNGLELEFKLNRLIKNNTDYLEILCKFNTSKISGNINTNQLCRTYHFIEDVNDVKHVLDITNSTIYPLKYYENIDGVNVESNIFVANTNILKYDKLKTYSLSNNINLSDNIDLNTVLNIGYYNKYAGNLQSIINKPNINSKFNLEVRKLGNEKIQIFEAVAVVNGVSSIKTYERISNTINNIVTWSNWIEHSKLGHTHQASDINNLPTGNTVVENLYWKDSVNIPEQLYTLYLTANEGWCCYVKSTKSIWSYDGVVWNNSVNYASPNTDGIISKNLFNKINQQYSLSKKLVSFDSFIHSDTVDINNVYGSNLEKIVDKHIDLVTRTTPLLNTLKEYTIQKGWNITMFGKNSIGIGTDNNSNFDNSINIGTGLKSSNKNQTILGNFNNENPNAIFVIGNGTSNTSRSNIFEILNTGVVKSIGYSTLTGTQNDILLGNGGTINKSDLIQSIINNLPSVSSERINVAPGNQTYVINWDNTRLTNFGRFGDIEVWIKTANNVYQKEVVPIAMITETGVDNQLKAVSYTITLTNNEAMIFIRKA